MSIPSPDQLGTYLMAYWGVAGLYLNVLFTVETRRERGYLRPSDALSWVIGWGMGGFAAPIVALEQLDQWHRAMRSTPHRQDSGKGGRVGA